MVRLSECSSYQGFELSSVFYEKVIVKVQGECKNSSSYWKFELSRVGVIGISRSKASNSGSNGCEFEPHAWTSVLR